MKKLVFLFAMVFVVSSVIAQDNESTVVVGGNNNTATILQSGFDNYNNLSQSQNNIFELDQIGNQNSSNFRQAATGSNEAYVDQLGNNNTLAGNLQGENNLLNLLQEGNNNWARVYQDARTHTADIVQNGDFNRAEIKQDSPHSTIDIDLVGNYNETYVNQQNSTSLNINEAIVDVEGDYNGDGTFGTQRLEITQDGEGNFGSMVITGHFNDSDIYQTGDFNTANNIITGSNNVVTVTQGL